MASRQFQLFKLGTQIVPYIPDQLGYMICNIAGDLAFLFADTQRRQVLNNLRHILPKKDRASLFWAARGVFRHTLKNYFDLLKLPSLSPDEVDRKMTVYGLENADKALAKGKGLILMTAHLGNFSFVLQSGARHNYPVSVIAEKIEPPELYDLMTKLRGALGVKIIQLGSNEARTIFKLLRNNEVLGLAGDRDVANNGVEVTFFGETVTLPAGPAALSLRTDAPILAGYTFRQNDHHSVAFIEPAFTFAKTGDSKHDIQAATQQIALILERYIRHAPDQWVVLESLWSLPGMPKRAPVKITPAEILSLDMATPALPKKSAEAESQPTKNKKPSKNNSSLESLESLETAGPETSASTPARTKNIEAKIEPKKEPTAPVPVSKPQKEKSQSAARRKQKSESGDEKAK